MGYFCKFIDFGGLICFVLQKNVVNHFYVSCETDKEIDKTKKNSSHHPLSVPEYGCVLTSPETFSQRSKKAKHVSGNYHALLAELFGRPSPRTSQKSESESFGL
jgi:hypothetical protein